MATERMAGGQSPVRLKTPLREEDVRALNVGDEVWLEGQIWGVRDASLIRLCDHNVDPGIDLQGAVFLHTAPSVRREGDSWIPVSVGTTTSMRMDRFTEGCLTRGVRAIVGKGGLSDESLSVLGSLGGVYLSITGGAASWETLQVEAIDGVVWEDLLPECLWNLRVRDFGPLFVALDSHGRSAYSDVRARAETNRAAAYALLDKPLTD